MTAKIFINYRRGEDSGYAGRLYDRLQEAFGPQQVSIDVDSITAGSDFVRPLNDLNAECDVLLAVIGKDWIDARDEKGARRLADSKDSVRIEIAAALGQDKRVIPVLVGGAQMPRSNQLPKPLRPLTKRNAVRLTYERFRADTQDLVNALQQIFEEIEAERKSQVEAKEAARRAEDERLQREKEAERRNAEEERARLAEEEAQAADVERRRAEAAAELRLREERDFNAAKKTNSAAAFEAFLAAHPKSQFGAEAQRLRAMFTRGDAFARAMKSDDARVLTSFRFIYKNGADVDKITERLRLIAPLRRRKRPDLVIIGPAALIVLLVGVIVVWQAIRPATTTQKGLFQPDVTTPSQVVMSSNPPVLGSATSEPAETPAVPAAPVTQQAPPTASEPKPLVTEYEDAAIPLPDNDEDAWPLVISRSDVVLLRRFIAKFPGSLMRRPAEARITALLAIQAAWDLLNDSQDPEQLRRFIDSFPNSPERPAAEQRLAVISRAATATASAAMPQASITPRTAVRTLVISTPVAPKAAATARAH